MTDYVALIASLRLLTQTPLRRRYRWRLLDEQRQFADINQPPLSPPVFREGEPVSANRLNQLSEGFQRQRGIAPTGSGDIIQYAKSLGWEGPTRA